jgi:hypothetical protein
VAAIAAALQVLVLAVAAGYGLSQVRELRRSRQLAVIVPGYERLHSADARAARRRLYQQIGTRYPNISRADTVLMESVIAEFQFLGQLTNRGLTDPETVAELYHGTVIHCWDECCAFVTDERISRKSSEYARAFEDLYDSCREYEDKHRDTSN